MSGWQMILPVAVSATILIALVITIIVRNCHNFSKQGTRITTTTTTIQHRRKMEGIRSQRVSTTNKPNYNLFKRGSYTKPLFSWADHPSLIADAVENGWSRFAFTNCSSPPSSLLNFVSDLHQNNNQRETQVEITWEVGAGAVDFMQKIKMNSGLKKKSSINSSSSSSMAAKSVVKTALPLPGPLLRHSPAFPQVAYFEITILSISSSCEEKGKSEGEKTKLIEEKNSEEKGKLDSMIHVPNKELKSRDGGVVIMSLGLTSSSVAPLKIPGSYHGSIGFNSDGSVNLDGIKLAFGSEKVEWGQEEKVIGCGFDPREKKVFFTLDSELVHMVHCKSDEFGAPLYPVMAANVEITLVVNLGQSRFSYEPTNAMRTPNPCFFGPLIASPGALGYEDSGELFSMGRIDSGWRNNCVAYSGTNSDVYSWHGGSHNNENENENSVKSRRKENGDGGDSEADLFELVVDVQGKSSNV